MTQSRTLERGLRALWELREHPSGMSVAELARSLGTHRAAIYRMVAPLSEHRLVRRLADGRYVLDAGLIELAGGVELRLQELATPVLYELAERLEAATVLTLRDGDEGIVAAVISPPRQVVHVTFRFGVRHSLALGASGHAIVAALPPRPGEAPEETEARARGWAVSRGQLLPGATGVAAAILGVDGEPVAAIGAVWIADVDIERAGAALADAARRLTATLRG